MENKIAVGFRIHRRSVADHSLEYLRNGLIQPLLNSIAQLRLYCPPNIQLQLLIAYDAEDRLLSEQIRLHLASPALLVPIQPWGFSTALNGLLFHVRQQKLADYILFLSTEIRFPLSIEAAAAVDAHAPNVLSEMYRLISADQSMLVVGHALDHEFQPDTDAVDLGGLTSPWNTISMWRVSRLALTGFLLVSDYPEMGAIEEVSVIALHQRLYGRQNARACLVKVGQGVQWNTADWKDPERQRWHAFKMSSKDSRAKFQLAQLNLQQQSVVADGSSDGAVVEHLII